MSGRFFVGLATDDNAPEHAFDATAWPAAAERSPPRGKGGPEEAVPAAEERAPRGPPSTWLSTEHPMTPISSTGSLAALCHQPELAPGASRATQIPAATGELLTCLARGEPIRSATLRGVMIAAFGGSDAEGYWLWKDVYEATEVAQVLFMRRFGPAILARLMDRHQLVATAGRA